MPLEPSDCNGIKPGINTGGDSGCVEAPGTSRPSTLSKCELCSSFVRPDRMRKHISKAHGPSKPPLDTRLWKQPISTPAMAQTKHARVSLEKPSRPCRCNGDNPNCSRCNGLGSVSCPPAEDAGYREYMLLANSIAATSMGPGRVGLHKKKLSKDSKKGTKSRSQQSVTLSRFPRHDVGAPRLSPRTIGRYICRECNSEFHALIVYERHQQSCKQARVVPHVGSPPKRDAKSLPVSKQTSALKRCELCPVELRVDRMERHVRKVHNHWAVHLKTTAQKYPIPATSMSDAKLMAKISADKILGDDDIRRASKDTHAGRFTKHATSHDGRISRENGRFISPPEYDAFDDESNAETI